MIDIYKLYHSVPEYRARLEQERKVHVYYLPGEDAQGNKTYVYALASALLHEDFLQSIARGVIPDYAVVVEVGEGEPGEAVRAKINAYYGFDHSD